MRVEISVEHRRRETPGTSGKRQAASRTFTSGSLGYESGDKTHIGFVLVLELGYHDLAGNPRALPVGGARAVFSEAVYWILFGRPENG